MKSSDTTCRPRRALGLRCEHGEKIKVWARADMSPGGLNGRHSWRVFAESDPWHQKVELSVPPTHNDTQSALSTFCSMTHLRFMETPGGLWYQITLRKQTKKNNMIHQQIKDSWLLNISPLPLSDRMYTSVTVFLRQTFVLSCLSSSVWNIRGKLRNFWQTRVARCQTGCKQAKRKKTNRPNPQVSDRCQLTSLKLLWGVCMLWWLWRPLWRTFQGEGQISIQLFC